MAWSGAARQAGELAEVARAAGSEKAFREELARGVHEQELRDRLVHLDDLVAAALQGGRDTYGFAPGELTWRWLFSLRVRFLRLEGADTADRAFAVARLRTVAADGTAAATDTLFSKLEGLSARYAPAGTIADEATLRRDLSGTALARSSRYPRAWAVLDRLAVQITDETRTVLADGASELRLERQEAGQVLAAQRHAGGWDWPGWPCDHWRARRRQVRPVPARRSPAPGDGGARDHAEPARPARHRA